MMDVAACFEGGVQGISQVLLWVHNCGTRAFGAKTPVKGGAGMTGGISNLRNKGTGKRDIERKRGLVTPPGAKSYKGQLKKDWGEHKE